MAERVVLLQPAPELRVIVRIPHKRRHLRPIILELVQVRILTRVERVLVPSQVSGVL